MRKEIFIHAYQLEVGDLINCWEGWHLVLDLKGSYIRGRGLLVNVKLHDGWHLVECLLKIKVCRHE